jgi:hypothetical protein
LKISGFKRSNDAPFYNSQEMLAGLRADLPEPVPWYIAEIAGVALD